MNTTPDHHGNIDSARHRSRWPIGRRRALALAAGVGLLSGGVVTIATAGSAGAIVDGDDTTASEHPWQVALVDDEGQFCGGSLVSDRVVVTAAHCVVGADASDMQIRAGVTDLRTDAGQTVPVAGVLEYPDYTGGSGDIALLVLSEPVAFGDSVAAIPIATPQEAASATTASVSGWGARSETDEGTTWVLQSADVPTVDDDTCDADLFGVDGERELCAGGTGTDSCYGDSGGPLTIETDRGRVLAGVTSWGEECGGSTPGVYAEVPAFADWISERVADPDAPLPDRLDVDSMDDEFFEDEFDEDWDDWDDTDWDDEFDENWDDDVDFDHDAIDQLDDDEFEDFLDGLTDEEFERYLDELDAMWDDTDWDDTDWDDTDWDDTSWDDTSWDDTSWDDTDWDDTDWDDTSWDDTDWDDTDWDDTDWDDELDAWCEDVPTSEA